MPVFDDSRIVQHAREHCPGGAHALIELVKFAIVIKIAGVVTNQGARFIIDHEVKPFNTLGGVYLLAIGCISIVACFYVAIWERMKPRDIGIVFRPILPMGRQLVLGYALGIVCMAGSFAFAHFFGAMDTVDNTQNVWAWKIVWYVFVYFFQAFGEEVMYRGAFMISASRQNPAWVALVISSVWFSYHHHNNAGYGLVAFVNLFLLAVICGITVFLTNRIWMATAIHAAWNLFQGKIFGVAVSGNTPNPIATVLVSTPKGNVLFSGGDMGLEGSLAATLMLAIVLGAIACVLLHQHDVRTCTRTV